MNGSTRRLPSIDALKDQARRLRAQSGAEAQAISHSRSLELLAHQYGYRDWNTLRAAVGNGPPPCPAALGDRVRGQYLGQAFDGEVIGLQALGAADHYRVTLRFERPVDVVAFDSFSNFRSRVSCVIRGSGESVEKTSDGRPHLRLEI